MTASKVTTTLKIVCLVIFSSILIGCTGGVNSTGSKKPNPIADSLKQELQFVNVETVQESAGNGWNTGKTLLGYLNTGSETICSMADYEIKNGPRLTTKEGKDYPVTVDVTGKFSIYPDDVIPLGDFPPIPPGFKIYTFGKNDTYAYLTYRYAEAANPLQIEFPKANFDGKKKKYDLNASVDIHSNAYAGEQMIYESVHAQPVKKISDLKDVKIGMKDKALEVSFTGECFYQPKDNANLLKAVGTFAVVHVKNTDKFEEYYPKSDWHIGYYEKGRGTYRELSISRPGSLPNSIGPGMETDLTFELYGTPVIFEGGCKEDYYILDYSMCAQ